MTPTVTFDQALSTVELLPLEEQEDLIALIQRRLLEHGRRRVIAEVQQGRRDYQNGLATPLNPKTFLDELDQ